MMNDDDIRKFIYEVKDYLAKYRLLRFHVFDFGFSGQGI